ncbi:DUF4355 domain-containing protein [Dehalobacter sp. TeCB1]|jgi:hypothetical protein|uniref:DUF4355 domain-containing protein n=1 Tax=Dehalobacter sp. TeCB1 TaxID=1843715 RepID=UPI00083A4703|nr:DUF4355 domain-containing protein [Dehalobacter sp. TeCB1]OCZ52198.1 hypothetical protein A7D23_11335 [Dehalobacter sp. TeCB1]
MDINEVKSYIEQNAQNEEVKNYIGGFVTADRVNNFLDTEEGKKLIQPKIDGHFTKGLETWKTNNLEKIINEEVTKRNPAETEEQKQIRELTERLNKKEAEEKRQTLLNKSLLKADEKKLPKELVSFFLGDDEDGTYKNLDTLANVFNTHIENVVKERLGNDSYKPPKNSNQTEADLIKEQIRKGLNGTF